MNEKSIACIWCFATAWTMMFASAYAAPTPDAKRISVDKRAAGKSGPTSDDIERVARWAVKSGDHRGLPFIVIDKVRARLRAFDGSGKPIRSTPILLGMGIGDALPPGAIDMDMYDTQPWQRITPAGRYFAEEGLNLKGRNVLWVDYDAAIAIHRLSTARTKQRRHERMASRTAADNRITYGCINVPIAFYEQVVHPYFRDRGGIVYVLPERAPVTAFLKSYTTR